MKTRLVPATDATGWTVALDGVAHGIAHTHGFAALMGDASGTPVCLFVAENDAGKVICPVAVRSFKDWRDVFTPYGFSGFSGTGALAGLGNAWRSLAREHGWVAAYVMQNPFTMPPEVPETWDDLYAGGRHVYAIDLASDEDARLSRVAARKRGTLRRWLAERPVETDQAALADAFVALYPDFMARRGAGRTYDFSPDVLARLVRLPGMVLRGVRDDAGRIACVALMGMTAVCGDYLFMVSGPGAQADSAGVLWCGLQAVAEEGVPVCNLGGGIREGDGVAEFKRRLGGAPVRQPVIRDILDANAYAAACGAAGITSEETAFFPAYHAR